MAKIESTGGDIKIMLVIEITKIKLTDGHIEFTKCLAGPQMGSTQPPRLGRPQKFSSVRMRCFECFFFFNSNPLIENGGAGRNRVSGDYFDDFDFFKALVKQRAEKLNEKLVIGHSSQYWIYAVEKEIKLWKETSSSNGIWSTPVSHFVVFTRGLSSQKGAKKNRPT